MKRERARSVLARVAEGRVSVEDALRVFDEEPTLLFAQRPDGMAAVWVAVGHRPDGDGRNVQTGVTERDVAHGRVLSASLQYPAYSEISPFGTTQRNGERSA